MKDRVMPPYQTEEPQPHLWDGTPMAAMPYVISKGNDTPGQRVYEGMNMSKAEKPSIFNRADPLLEKLLDHDLQFAQQTGAAQSVDDLMDTVRRLSAINAELTRVLERCVDHLSGPTAWTQDEEDLLLGRILEVTAKAQGEHP